MLYEIRFTDHSGKSRVAAEIPAEMLELICVLIERIAVKFEINLVKI